MIEVRAAVRRDGFGLDVDFSTVGRVTALFGRSGSGKTTVADLVAGLVRPDRGRVLIDGAAVADAAAGLNEPAWRRRIGYVFQDARLFPHLTVRGNLLYGARRRRIARRSTRSRDCSACQPCWSGGPADCRAGRRAGSPSAAPC